MSWAMVCWRLFQNLAINSQLLRSRPTDLIKPAVEELLRYDTPLQLFRRWVLEDLEFGGIQFKQGEQIALLFGAANRDPEAFAQPDQLDITRVDNPHVTFSLGIHFCLGAPLARMELQIALATLMRRLPTMRLDYAPEYRDSYVIRGLQDLIVHF